MSWGREQGLYCWELPGRMGDTRLQEPCLLSVPPPLQSPPLLLCPGSKGPQALVPYHIQGLRRFRVRCGVGEGLLLVESPMPRSTDGTRLS